MSISLGEMAQGKLIYKGAEAEIYVETWHGQVVVRKTRVAKAYRVPELDEWIRRSRTGHEATMMQEVRKLGIPTPVIQHIEPETWTLIMEYIHGPTLKEELGTLPEIERRSRCSELGRLIGMMHDGGIVHGDLTISNVLSEDGKLFIIDFGLGDFSKEIEDRAVDLLLLNRVMKSTHYALHATLFKAFLRGYSKVAGKRKCDEVIAKMHEVERRGRYFERG